MSEISKKLFALAEAMEAAAKLGVDSSVGDALQKVRAAAINVGKAWSGSSFGYHSRVYYADFRPTPPGAHFSMEWGLMGNRFPQSTIGDWRECTFEAVRKHIFSLAGIDTLQAAEQLAKKAGESFKDGREEFLSHVIVLEPKKDSFISRLQSQAEKLKQRN